MRKNRETTKKIVTTLLIIVIVAVLYLVFSKANSVQKEFVSYVKSNCTVGQSCTIRLSDITDFEWDMLYYSEERLYFETSIKNNPELLPFELPRSDKLIAGQMVFALNDELVYYEEIERGVDKREKNEISIAGENIQMYTPDTAVFEVNINSDPGYINFPFYHLKPISPDTVN